MQASAETITKFTDPYQRIRPGRTMTAADAQACFYGPRRFILVTDHWVRSLKPNGQTQATAWTKVMTNHDPAQPDRQAIEAYGSLATRRPDITFCKQQSTRLDEFDSNSRRFQNRARWGRVEPWVFHTMSQAEHKRTWFNKEKSVQKQSSDNASAVGASAGETLSVSSTTDDKIIAFCGRKPVSFVEPAFIQYIGTDANNTEVHQACLRHHYNEVPFTNNDIIRSLFPVGDSQVQALTKTRNHILALNKYKSARQSWVEATAQDINRMMESQLCNARHYGGLDGKYVGANIPNLNRSPCNSRTTCFSS